MTYEEALALRRALADKGLICSVIQDDVSKKFGVRVIFVSAEEAANLLCECDYK